MSILNRTVSTEILLEKLHNGIKSNKVPYMGCQSLLYQSRINKESYVRQEICKSVEDVDNKPLSIPTSILIHQDSPQSIPSFSTYHSEKTVLDQGSSTLNTNYDMDTMSDVYDIPPNDTYNKINSKHTNQNLTVPLSVKKRSSLLKRPSKLSSNSSLNGNKNILTLCVGNRSPSFKRSVESNITLPEIVCSVSNRESVFMSSSITNVYQPINSWDLFFTSFSLRSNNAFFWTRNSLKKPILSYVERNDWKSAIRSFKVIQKYMGDRRTRKSPSDLISILNLHVSDQESLRDEIFLQICKQTIKNPDFRSRARGWELLAECLLQFSPSSKLLPYLDGYIIHSLVQEQRKSSFPMNNCFNNLQKCEFNMSSIRGIINEEILQNLESSVFMDNYQSRQRSFSENIQFCAKEPVSFFNQSLQTLMKLQSMFMPIDKVPIILSTLCRQLAKDLEGTDSFLSLYKLTYSQMNLSTVISKLDRWCYSICEDGPLQSQLISPDLSLIALQLLMYWFDSLSSPVISQQMAFMSSFSLKDLSKINKRVVTFVAEFLLIHVISTSKDNLRNMASFLCSLIFQLPKDKFYPFEEPKDSVYLKITLNVFRCIKVYEKV